ncbi:hypothetical protein KW842_25215 [Duganella sp. sic0402]|uniref:hypothetical protein n=1 Tax=Duganella sp. sic0402 TaxID=2854786 RepID=UPI001C449105|nr:hypothetical protein [Duganella sp. sic0402]MBV7539073.1 hypothetical protein [Duganella sp. sic0402]
MAEIYIIAITFFDYMADNFAASTRKTWGEVVSQFTVHSSALSHKTLLPLFSPWRYKEVSDPTVDNGLDKDGNSYKITSAYHVRRVSTNLVDLYMIVLDYDGNRSLEQIRELFKPWEHIVYTTLNHLVNGKVRARVVLLLATPMPFAVFNELQTQMQQWATDLGADSSTMDVNRIFILPAVRDEDRHNAQSWHNEGKPFDWHIFEAMPVPPKPQKSNPLSPTKMGQGQIKLRPDDVLSTASGPVMVRDINRKISNVLCPFHGDVVPKEFVAVTKAGTPYLVCKKCGTIYMERAKSDGIMEGIAKIAERKRLREGMKP